MKKHQKTFIQGYYEKHGIIYLVGSRAGKIVYLPTLNEAKHFDGLPALTEEHIKQMGALLADLVAK